VVAAAVRRVSFRSKAGLCATESSAICPAMVSTEGW
jgi:hypothetical protein